MTISAERLTELVQHWHDGAERACKALAEPSAYGLVTGLELDQLVRGLGRNRDTTNALLELQQLRAATPPALTEKHKKALEMGARGLESQLSDLCDLNAEDISRRVEQAHLLRALAKGSTP